MDKTNAKRLSPQGQYELRKQIVRMEKKGMTRTEIAEIAGVSVGHVSRVWSAYQKEGNDGIKLKKRGVTTGSGRTLTPEQEREIQKLIVDKTPDQMKFSWALWTREAICALIKRKYKINMPLRSISHYLKRWGFTAQRPTKKAYQQDPVKVKRFLEEEYPAISARAKAEKAEIYWGDETGIQNSADYQKGVAPRGKTPVLLVESKKVRINMISAITNRGKVRFMLYEDTMNCDRLIEFMKRLIKDAGRKVFLILDNLRVHHGKKVKRWLEENMDKIELFFLPPYAPEHNPDEYLNHDLKRNVHSGQQVCSKDDIKNKTRSFMRTIQHRLNHVMSYFRHKSALFAA